MVMLVGAALISTPSVSVSTTPREPTVSAVFLSTMTRRGDMVPLTTPTPANRAIAIITLLVVTMMPLWIHSQTAMRLEEEACVITVKMTLVGS